MTAYKANLDLVKSKEGLQNLFSLVGFPIRLGGFGFQKLCESSIGSWDMLK
jgi:hypothetical protein